MPIALLLSSALIVLRYVQEDFSPQPSGLPWWKSIVPDFSPLARSRELLCLVIVVAYSASNGSRYMRIVQALRRGGKVEHRLLLALGPYEAESFVRYRAILADWKPLERAVVVSPAGRRCGQPARPRDEEPKKGREKEYRQRLKYQGSCVRSRV